QPWFVASPNLFAEGRAARELRDAEHHELGGLDGRDTDLDHELTGVDDLGWVRLLVALDVERLGRRGPEQGPVAPGAHEERVEGPLDALPQVEVVGLEDDPLGALEDRLLDVVEEPPHVEVLPGRVARQRPGAPDPDAPTGERPDAVDAVGVEL